LDISSDPALVLIIGKHDSPNVEKITSLVFEDKAPREVRT